MWWSNSYACWTSCLYTSCCNSCNWLSCVVAWGLPAEAMGGWNSWGTGPQWWGYVQKKDAGVNSLTFMHWHSAGQGRFNMQISLSKSFTFITKFTTVTPFLINLSFSTWSIEVYHIVMCACLAHAKHYRVIKMHVCTSCLDTSCCNIWLSCVG